MVENKVPNPQLPEQLANLEGSRYNIDITGATFNDFDTLNGFPPEIPAAGNVSTYKPKKREHRDPITPPIPDPIDPPIITPTPVPVPVPTPIPTPYKEKTALQKIWQGIKYLPHILVIGGALVGLRCCDNPNFIPSYFSQPTQREVKQPEDDLASILTLTQPNINYIEQHKVSTPTQYRCDNIPAGLDVDTTLKHLLNSSLRPATQEDIINLRGNKNRLYVAKVPSLDGTTTITITGLDPNRIRATNNLEDLLILQSCNGEQTLVRGTSRITGNVNSTINQYLYNSQ